MTKVVTYTKGDYLRIRLADMTKFEYHEGEIVEINADKSILVLALEDKTEESFDTRKYYIW